MSKENFDLIYLDSWGLYGIATHLGAFYFLIIIDDYLWGTWFFFFFLIKPKGETFLLFEHFVKMVKNQFNKQVKKILSKIFQNFIL